MRRFLISFIAIAISIASLPVSYAQEPVLGNYIVDFVPVNTPLGKSPLTKDLMDQWMTQVGVAFNELSNSQITFTKGELLSAIDSNSMKSSTDLANIFKGNQKATPTGYKRLITVGVITNDASLSFSGQASGDSYVLVNGLYETNLENVDILLHEFAHNLGLGHANSITCTIVFKNSTCNSTEYGDYSDVMGRYRLNAARAQAYLRLSAPYLEEWGLIKSSQVQIIDNSAEVVVAPVYPINGSGNKIVYLPVYGRNAYSIEYRAGVGVDQDLTSAKVNIYNKPNYYYPNTLSYGLQIRYLGDKNSKTGELLPTISGSNFGDNFIFVDSLSSRQGFDPGARFTLPDGSLIEYLSGDNVNGAKLKITRPADTEAPTLTSTTASVNNREITNQPEFFAKFKSPSEVLWPSVSIEYKGLQDNRRVSEIAMLLDGVIAKTQTDNSTSNGKIEFKINSYGDHSVKLQAKDAAGNLVESANFPFKVSKFVYLEVEPSVTPGTDPLTELDIYIQYEEDAESTFEYSLANMNFGKLSNVEKSPNGITFHVSSLPRNSKFEAILKRIDPAGNPTLDTKVSGEVDQSVCTKSLCYVGVTWDADDFFWSIPAPTLQLQEKVGSNWKVVASAKPYKSSDALKSAPYAYDLSYVTRKAGVHTYRLYQPAFTYKGKKYSPYVGKVFTQKVIA